MADRVYGAEDLPEHVRRAAKSLNGRLWEERGCIEAEADALELIAVAVDDDYDLAHPLRDAVSLLRRASVLVDAAATDMFAVWPERLR